MDEARREAAAAWQSMAMARHGMAWQGKTRQGMAWQGTSWAAAEYYGARRESKRGQSGSKGRAARRGERGLRWWGATGLKGVGRAEGRRGEGEGIEKTASRVRGKQLSVAIRRESIVRRRSLRTPTLVARSRVQSWYIVHAHTETVCCELQSWTDGSRSADR